MTLYTTVWHSLQCHIDITTVYYAIHKVHGSINNCLPNSLVIVNKCPIAASQILLNPDLTLSDESMTFQRQTQMLHVHLLFYSQGYRSCCLSGSPGDISVGIQRDSHIVISYFSGTNSHYR